MLISFLCLLNLYCIQFFCRHVAFFFNLFWPHIIFLYDMLTTFLFFYTPSFCFSYTILTWIKILFQLAPTGKGGFFLWSWYCCGVIGGLDFSILCDLLAVVGHCLLGFLGVCWRGFRGFCVRCSSRRDLCRQYSEGASATNLRGLFLGSLGALVGGVLSELVSVQG